MITTEQRRRRSQGIGGSDAAAVLGVSPWKTPAELFVEKTAPVEESAEVDGENLLLDLGNVMEAHIASRWAKIEGKTVTTADTLVHPEHPWMLGNVDGLVGDDEGLEVKLLLSPRQAARLGEGDDEGLIEHVAQCHHYLEVTGRKVWHLVYFDPMRGLRPYVVKRDEGFGRMLVARERAFWERVQKGEAPPVDPTKETIETIAKLHEIANSGLVEATPEQVAVALEYGRVRDERVALEKQEDALKAQLAASIGPLSGFSWAGGQVTWKNNAKGGTDWKGLAMSLGATPDQVEQFTKKIGPRVMRLKIDKEKQA